MEFYRKQEQVKGEFIKAFESQHESNLMEVKSKINTAIDSFQGFVTYTFVDLKSQRIDKNDFIRYLKYKNFTVTENTHSITISWGISSSSIETAIYDMIDEIISARDNQF